MAWVVGHGQLTATAASAASTLPFASGWCKVTKITLTEDAAAGTFTMSRDGDEFISDSFPNNSTTQFDYPGGKWMKDIAVDAISASAKVTVDLA